MRVEYKAHNNIGRGLVFDGDVGFAQHRLAIRALMRDPKENQLLFEVLRELEQDEERALAYTESQMMQDQRA